VLIRELPHGFPAVAILALPGRLLDKLIGPVFDRIANTLVEAFVTRANQVYGTKTANSDR